VAVKTGASRLLHTRRSKCRNRKRCMFSSERCGRLRNSKFLITSCVFWSPAQDCLSQQTVINIRRIFLIWVTVSVKTSGSFLSAWPWTWRRLDLFYLRDPEREDVWISFICVTLSVKTSGSFWSAWPWGWRRLDLFDLRDPEGEDVWFILFHDTALHPTWLECSSKVFVSNIIPYRVLRV